MPDSTEKLRYFSGPLNLCRDTKRADTVMGTQLLLDDSKFDALDMLVSSEGESLPFEQLYESVWGDPDNPVSLDEARLELKDLIEQVKEEYANIRFSDDQQHFHHTTTGITPEAYYGTLMNTVIDEINKGKFDHCRSGQEIINKVAADKSLLPEW